MKIWITRHGQTDLNKNRIMQGSINEPLNETGIAQAYEVKEKLQGISFDAVISSPLIRAVKTASIIGDIPESEVIKDRRLVEFRFGRFENMEYSKMGPAMILYWILPELFPRPKTVESIPYAIKRIKSFLEDLKTKDYENVLIVCHGGIIRVLSGVLEGRKNNIKWRPKPHNCEVRTYEL
ncbi:MAG: histidine phosphatase family protein [Lachnospiraceae bacterium]|nr:histidine phosphatase family protein [Lachnospiraceae bacterium]